MDQDPIRFGRGGLILPRTAVWLIFVAICAQFLYQVWRDVKLDDLRPRKNRQTTSPVGDSAAQSTGEPSSGVED